MQRPLLWMATCLITGHAAIALAQTPTPSRQAGADEASITHILDDEAAAWRKGDAEAFAAHVAPNVIFTNTVGMFSTGKQPFIAQHRKIFATIYKGSEVHQFVQRITFIAGGPAIVDTVAKLSGFQQLPTGASAVGGSLYTRLEQVMVKTGTNWTIVSFHNVPIQPEFVDAGVRALTSTDGH